MGERQSGPLQFSFDPWSKVDLQGSRVTSDGGLILGRELDEHLGFGDLITQHLPDARRGENTQFRLADLLRQSICSGVASYEDVDGAERLWQGPTSRLIDSEKIWGRGAALTSRLRSFEIDLLAQDENVAGLGATDRELTGRAGTVDSPRRVVLDMDSTEVPVCAQREQSACNGHFESTCYHPPPVIESGRRLPGGQIAAGQRSQRRGLEGVATAGVERHRRHKLSYSHRYKNSVGSVPPDPNQVSSSPRGLIHHW